MQDCSASPEPGVEFILLLLSSLCWEKMLHSYPQLHIYKLESWFLKYYFLIKGKNETNCVISAKLILVHFHFGYFNCNFMILTTKWDFSGNNWYSIYGECSSETNCFLSNVIFFIKKVQVNEYLNVRELNIDIKTYLNLLMTEFPRTYSLSSYFQFFLILKYFFLGVLPPLKGSNHISAMDISIRCYMYLATKSVFLTHQKLSSMAFHQ